MAAAAATRTDLPRGFARAACGDCDQVVTDARLSLRLPMSARSRSIPETGVVEIVRYTAVDDVGRAVNPLIIHGQTHGGIAQGVGQALLEHCYLRPRAAGSCCRRRSWTTPCRAPTYLPFFDTEHQRSADDHASARHARRPAKAAPRRRSPS